MKHVLVDARGEELLERVGKFRVPRRLRFSIVEFMSENRTHKISVSENGTFTSAFFVLQENLSPDHAPQGTKIRVYRQKRAALVKDTYEAIGNRELFLGEFYEAILYLGIERRAYNLTQGQRVVGYVRGADRVLFCVQAFWVEKKKEWFLNVVVMDNINPHHDNALVIC